MDKKRNGEIDILRFIFAMTNDNSNISFLN